MTRNLDEFIVFRQPGHYVVHCSSSRLINNGAALESSSLALDILPRDDAEDARQFASARATLESGKPPKEPGALFVMGKENADRPALFVLCAISTRKLPLSIWLPFMAKAATPSAISNTALYASEHREAIVRELERRPGRSRSDGHPDATSSR